MRLSKRLLTLIQESDTDEGELLLKVMLDPDSDRDEMEGAIYDFITELPDYDSINEAKTQLYIQNNLLEDDEEDDSDLDEPEDEDDDLVRVQRELEEDNEEDLASDEAEGWLDDREDLPETDEDEE